MSTPVCAPKDGARSRSSASCSGSAVSFILWRSAHERHISLCPVGRSGSLFARPCWWLLRMKSSGRSKRLVRVPITLPKTAVERLKRAKSSDRRCRTDASVLAHSWRGVPIRAGLIYLAVGRLVRPFKLSLPAAWPITRSIDHVCCSAPARRLLAMADGRGATARDRPEPTSCCPACTRKRGALSLSGRPHRAFVPAIHKLSEVSGRQGITLNSLDSRNVR